MMANGQHPELGIEQENLEQTVAALNGKLGVMAARSYEAGNAYSKKALIEMAEHTWQDLHDQINSPYFGRIDFQASDEESPDTYYIGYVGFDHQGKFYVHDWRAGIASLYNQARSNQKEYTYRNNWGHKVSGNLFLKRQIDIEKQRIQAIEDFYDRRDPLQPKTVIVDPDEYLAQVLAGKRDIQLQDIVKTIQRHQDELVRANAKQILVVQGSAGSGKTSIALQRLAYLLYPDLQTNLNPNQCIVFGPSRLFLGYIANVLPRLRVRGIAQKTLTDWQIERLNIHGEVEDKTLDLLLSPKAKAAEKEAQYKSSQFRTSMQMKQVLERYMAYRHKIQFPAEGWQFTGLGRFKLTFQISQVELVEMYEKGAHLSIAKHREQFYQDLNTKLVETYEDAIARGSVEFAAPAHVELERESALTNRAKEMERDAELAREMQGMNVSGNDVAEMLQWGADGSREMAYYYRREADRKLAIQKRAALDDDVKRRTLDELSTAVRAKINQALPLLNLPKDYYGLLNNRELLGQLSPEHADKFIGLGQLPLPGGSVDRSDLPAMMYLHLLFTGIEPLFEHIVVDEAQDVAPLEFEILRRFSRNQSFTIMGDLAQSIYSYRGITSWEQVKQIFPDTSVQYSEINTSYRSTYEILNLARRVLEAVQKTGNHIGLPQPIARHGKPPKFHNVSKPEDLAARMWKVVLEERKAKAKNIAIICKSVSHCKSVERSLKKVANEELRVATSADFKYEGGLLIAPIHLAKGMEFEVVLLAEVDSKTYSADEFDGRLLYVGITRALHVLHLFWSGQISVHLKDVVPSESAVKTQ